MKKLYRVPMAAIVIALAIVSQSTAATSEDVVGIYEMSHKKKIHAKGYGKDRWIDSAQLTLKSDGTFMLGDTEGTFILNSKGKKILLQIEESSLDAFEDDCAEIVSDLAFEKGTNLEPWEITCQVRKVKLSKIKIGKKSDKAKGKIKVTIKGITLAEVDGEMKEKKFKHKDIYKISSVSELPIPEHTELSFSGYPANCLSCHEDEADEMLQSTHYRWLGEAPDMVNGGGELQGKLDNAVNSYCVHILGNWPVCGSCHAGRGLEPDDPGADQNNIDCLICHSVEYAAARTRLDDGTMGVTTPTDAMVHNVGRPTRGNCLKCHAYAGGGDGVKRGDLSQALIDNIDARFDVHMDTTGADLSCQSCHEFEEHRVIGKGSDLRPTDDPDRGAEVACTTCHEAMAGSGHDQKAIKTHVARVACQSCHIPTYAKVATETHRDWLIHHDGTDATTCTDETPCPGHPRTTKAANLVPQYKWWNRQSDNMLLYDDASQTYNEVKETYPTSTPLGSVLNGKLYPFKYKTASQPMTVADNRLVALDTWIYLKGSGNVNEAVQAGLANMGYSASEPYQWVTTDTYQLINHGVEPSGRALDCSACHGNTKRMDLQGELGYDLMDTEKTVCTQCHKYEKAEKSGYKWVHKEHVREKKYDCSWCHRFSRPERGLRPRK